MEDTKSINNKTIDKSMESNVNDKEKKVTKVASMLGPAAERVNSMEMPPTLPEGDKTGHGK